MTASFYEFFCLHRKNLLYSLVRRNLAIKYRGSILGFFWTLLIPFCQVLVFYFIYQIVLKIQIPNYLVFIVSGILPWIFFSSTVNESFESIVAGGSLLTQVSIPLQVFSASSSATQFSNLAFSLPVLGLLILFSTVHLGWLSLLFFPLTAVLYVFTYSLALIFSCLYVVFRDLKHLFGIIVQLWLYLTPVFYSIDLVPEKYRWAINLNPLTGYFSSIRAILVFNTQPDWGLTGIFVGWTLVLVFIANLIRVRAGPYLIERI